MIYYMLERNQNEFYINLADQGYKLKRVGYPTVYLGGDFIRVKDPEQFLTWGASSYIEKILLQYKTIFQKAVPLRQIHAPLEPGDHPEMDESDILSPYDTTIYLSLIGMLQWAVTLGRIDIACATMTMSRFRPAPRVGHLDRLKRIFSFLANYKKTAINSMLKCQIIVSIK